MTSRSPPRGLRREKGSKQGRSILLLAAPSSSWLQSHENGVQQGDLERGCPYLR